MSHGPLHFRVVDEPSQLYEMPPSRSSHAAADVLDLLKEGPMTTREIADRLHLPYRSLINTMTHLRTSSKIIIPGIRNRQRLYALNTQNEADQE